MAHVMRGGESVARQSFVDSVAPAELDKSRLDTCIERATEALLAEQRRDGHWVFELEADATIPAEYVLLKHYLGEPDAGAGKEDCAQVSAPHAGCARRVAVVP